MVATRVTLIVLTAIFSIGVMSVKNGKTANRMLAGTARLYQKIDKEDDTWNRMRFRG